MTITFSDMINVLKEVHIKIIVLAFRSMNQLLCLNCCFPPYLLELRKKWLKVDFSNYFFQITFWDHYGKELRHEIQNSLSFKVLYTFERKVVTFFRMETKDGNSKNENRIFILHNSLFVFSEYLVLV